MCEMRVLEQFTCARVVEMLGWRVPAHLCKAGRALLVWVVDQLHGLFLGKPQIIVEG